MADNVRQIKSRRLQMIRGKKGSLIPERSPGFMVIRLTGLCLHRSIMKHVEPRFIEAFHDDDAAVLFDEWRDFGEGQA